MNIVENPKFELQEFSERWYRARMAGLGNVLADYSEGEPFVQNKENDLLRLISQNPERRELALKNVFDYSRRFAISASRHMGISFEIADFAKVLPFMGISCFSTLWRNHNQAQVLERKGCHTFSDLGLGSFGCDYWREALDGLVMGLGENERLSRHRSQGHGDADCLDVLYAEEAQLPKIVSLESPYDELRNNPKFGLVPSEMLANLEKVIKRFAGMKANLMLEGLSEGTLYYRLEGEESVLCGAGANIMHDLLKRDLEKLYPGLLAKDVSPQAVYGTAAV